VKLIRAPTGLYEGRYSEIFERVYPELHPMATDAQVQTNRRNAAESIEP